MARIGPRINIKVHCDNINNNKLKSYQKQISKMTTEKCYTTIRPNFFETFSTVVSKCWQSSWLAGKLIFCACRLFAARSVATPSIVTLCLSYLLSWNCVQLFSNYTFFMKLHFWVLITKKYRFQTKSDNINTNGNINVKMALTPCSGATTSNRTAFSSGTTSSDRTVDYSGATTSGGTASYSSSTM